MEDERAALIRRMMALDKRLYDYLLVSRIPAWAEVDLTMPQLKVLFLAAGPEPLPTSRAARSLGMTLSTATGVVDRLVAQGLVQRREAPADRRIVLLTATDSGRALIDRLLSAGLSHFRELLDRLTLEQLEVVARVIDLLYNAAMELPGSKPSAASQRPEEFRPTPNAASAVE